MRSSYHNIAIVLGAMALFLCSSGGSGTVSAVAATAGKTSTAAISMGRGTSVTFSGSDPNAQYLGLTWILYDPSGNGKTALGIVGATAP